MEDQLQRERADWGSPRRWGSVVEALAEEPQ